MKHTEADIGHFSTTFMTFTVGQTSLWEGRKYHYFVKYLVYIPSHTWILIAQSKKSHICFFPNLPLALTAIVSRTNIGKQLLFSRFQLTATSSHFAQTGLYRLREQSDAYGQEIPFGSEILHSFWTLSNASRLVLYGNHICRCLYL